MKKYCNKKESKENLLKIIKDIPEDIDSFIIGIKYNNKTCISFTNTDEEVVLLDSLIRKMKMEKLVNDETLNIINKLTSIDEDSAEYEKVLLEAFRDTIRDFIKTLGESEDEITNENN